jgi:hypothetical protein
VALDRRCDEDGLTCQEAPTRVIIDVQTGQAGFGNGYCGVTALNWSPDAARLAFSVIAFPLGETSGLFVLDTAAGEPREPRQVMADRFVTEVRWSPDGETLFASAAPCWGCDAMGRTWLAVPAAGGDVRELAAGTSTALSPSTRTLAYARDEAISALGTIEHGQSAEIWPADSDWQIGDIAWEPGGDILAIARSHTFGARGCREPRRERPRPPDHIRHFAGDVHIADQRRMAVIDHAAGTAERGRSTSSLSTARAIGDRTDRRIRGEMGARQQQARRRQPAD